LYHRCGLGSEPNSLDGLVGYHGTARLPHRFENSRLVPRRQPPEINDFHTDGVAFGFFGGGKRRGYLWPIGYDRDIPALAHHVGLPNGTLWSPVGTTLRPAYRAAGSRITTGSRSLIAVISNPFASAGVAGIPTLRPGTWINHDSGLCEWAMLVA